MKTIHVLIAFLLSSLLFAEAQAPRPPGGAPPESKPPEELYPSKLFPQFRKFLVLLDGAVASGSASVIKIHGIPLVVTNAHVLSGNGHIEASLLDNTRVTLGKLGVAKLHDVAVLEQKSMTDGLVAMEDVDKQVTIGDDVVVLGNSAGGHVITEIPGKVLGIGPDRIEIDAPFVHGNSGSPIIHVKTGQVIGIATYSTQMPENLATFTERKTRFEKVRHFGFRLDSIKGWDFPSPERFTADGLRIAALEKQTNDVIALIEDFAQDGYVSAQAHEAAGNRLREPVNDFLKVIARPDMAPQSVQEAKLRLLRALEFECWQDIRRIDDGWKLQPFSDSYHVQQYSGIRKDRQALKRIVTELENIQDTKGKITLP